MCCSSGKCELMVYNSQKFAMSEVPNSARLRCFCRRFADNVVLFAARISTNRRLIETR